LNLAILDGRRRPPTPYNLQNARRDHYRTTLGIVESAKQVAWEQGLLDFFLSIRPFPQTLVFRQKTFEPLAFQLGRNQALLA
jgi:hypothetical protein